MSDAWDAIQDDAVDALFASWAAGHTAPVLVGPTGSGKTRVAARAVETVVAEGKTVGILTNRRLMVDQLARSFADHGIDCGVRAAGHRRSDNAPVQVVSVHTERSRVEARKEWEAFVPDVAVVDEAHVLAGTSAVRHFLHRVCDKGGRYFGLTATPVDLAEDFDDLIQFATPSQLRTAGAIVRADHYGPDEPDVRRHKKLTAKLKAGLDLPEEGARQVMMTPGLFGRVWEHYLRLNPERKPTLLFAPDVAGSLWFAEQFWANGITAAHIDGAGVWWNGASHSGKAVRDDVREASRTGELAVVCNRFVLREGVDWPWLEHGIFATIFGSLVTYLQSGGRLLRSSPATGKTRCVIQDHGGNWLRHGSVNADRDWYLWGTRRMYAGLRDDRVRSGKEREPAVCPQCSAVQGGHYAGMKCWQCGHAFGARRSRPVRTTEGTLTELFGDVYVPVHTRRPPTAAADWERWFWAAYRSKKGATFTQALGWFWNAHRYQPPRDLPLMPRHDADWYRVAKDVDPKDLIPKPGYYWWAERPADTPTGGEHGEEEVGGELGGEDRDGDPQCD